MTHTHYRLHFSVLTGLLLAIIWTGPARAVTTNCNVIASLPAVIDSSGIYCLKGNLTTSQTRRIAIYIQADDITLDLNGYTLDGSSAGERTGAYGIRAIGRKNLTIKNGTVRGFYRGIQLNGSGSSGHVVEGIRAEGNTFLGISVVGNGSIIRGNQVLDTGGGTYKENMAAFGIGTRGNSVQVLDNDVINTHATGTANAFGIFVNTGSHGVVVRDNRVSNPSLPSSAYSYGVNVKGGSNKPSQNVAVVNNHVTRMTHGVRYTAYTSGIYAHNLVAGCTTPFTGGSPAGRTNFSQ